jgi:hypothetical protein
MRLARGCVAGALWLLAALVPRPAAAQNSVYGLAGIGFPEEPLGARARGLGGGAAAFDPTSALNPGAVAGFARLRAAFSGGTTLRSYTAGDSSASGLRETRFPFGLLGGRIAGTPVSFALSFSTYAERSYDVTTTGTQVLRGETLTVRDRIASDGAISDLRGALAMQLVKPLLVGAAVHVIAGSSRFTVRRVFSDSTAYLPYSELRQAAYSGTGFSVGAVLLATRWLELAGAARMDGRLESHLEDGTLAESVRLPWTVSAGLRVLPLRGIGWSTTVSRRDWSRAQPDLPAPARAFDTWEVASGLELENRPGGPRLPLRAGVRYRQLPFSNVGTQPAELVWAAGTGLAMAGGRAAVDLAVERLKRWGGGADERGWHIVLGIQVLP